MKMIVMSKSGYKNYDGKVMRTDEKAVLEGKVVADVLGVEDFEREGIEVRFQNFTHPVYPRLHTEEIIPFLSTLDLFFNCN